MSAKDAVLLKTGSHWIDEGNYSSRANGIGKEEVFLYFSAKWRGKSVIVTMRADRYAASHYSDDMKTSTNQLVPWRVYAQDAKYDDPEKPGHRGDDVTGTGRSALSRLCEPIATEWLASEAYTASFQRALAHMVMRMFQDEYRWSRNVTEALLTFGDRLSPSVLEPISTALDARAAYEAAKERAFEAINQEPA